MAKRKSYYWHVPVWADVSSPTQGNGVSNVGDDIFVELLNSDFAPPADPRQDNFVVERIIGQYMLVSSGTAESGSRIVHHRIYVVDGDQNTHQFRDIFSQDDADSSFLWHLVEGVSASSVGGVFGSWRKEGANEPQKPFERGRLGSFDVRVGRRVDEGQSLIWHTQLDNQGELVNGTWDLIMWVRVLMREA